jgi:WD40 repeat protein
MVRGDLPSESALPGEVQAAAPLPGESQLPAYSTASAAPIDAAIDSAQPADDEPTVDQQTDERAAENESTAPDATTLGESVVRLAAQLPGERTTPPRVKAVEASAELLPLKGSPDGIPWLRLNRPGHTAPLRAIAFSSDGRKLATAGDDKSLIIWSNAGPSGSRPFDRWSYERTIRWQIQRGTRGRIYALAAGPEWLALAGEGAMGASGEILLVDPESGEQAAVLNDIEQGHRQVVVALSFGPAARPLTVSSLSIDGVLVHWSLTPAGLWKATRLHGPDSEEPGVDAALAARLLAGRALSAVANLSDGEVVAAVYAGLENNRSIWQLERFDASTNRRLPLAVDGQNAPHWDFVTAMASGADGARLASADGAGNVYLWDVDAGGAKVHRFPRLPAQALSLAFDAAGRTLVLGSALSPRTGRSRVEVWDVSNFEAPRRLAGYDADGVVKACSLSPDGQTVAWTAGAEATVRQVSGGENHVLGAGVRPPLKVAFAAEAPFYRLGFSTTADAAKLDAIEFVFDANLLRLEQVNSGRAGRWLPESWLSNGWEVREETAAGRSGLWFYQGGLRRAQIPLNEVRDGAFRTVCWIPSRQQGGPPEAAAVGTSSGEIFLFRPAADGAAPIIRRFRGHSADVASIAVSLDLRFLASASLDGAIGVWPISGITRNDALMQRWGAGFEASGGQLVAAKVQPEGPVYFRGLRSGDRLVELRYRSADEDHVATTPEQMLAALSECPWNAQMLFKFARGRDIEQAFQIVPAWQQLASLFVADDGEWAYWTPAGYYDASFEGHKLFGWQINRGLERLPDFFLAAQFRAQLERPGPMSRLLRSGNLEAAFEAAQLDPPANSPDALVNLYRLKPEVEILSPGDGETIRGPFKVRARISADSAEGLVPPKAFANGVAAIGRRLVSETVEEGRRIQSYEWQMNPPSDARLLVQVAAATENEVPARDEVVLANESPPSTRRPRLFLLSVGVDRYRDAQIPTLTTAVATIDKLQAAFQRHSQPMYQLHAASLIGDRATKASWRVLTDDYAAKLAQGVAPDDVLLVFLSGHGLQAPDDAGYQFIASDARYADVMAGQYGDCLSMADLSAFADIPCRKLVILNTCHGGAAQPLLHRELKSAIRALQDDLLLTLAASGGEQEAVEGRFARRLLEAIDGAADADGDGVVTFSEAAGYVERTVAADSSGEDVRQTPSAGPKELLSFATTPLTRAGGRAVSTRMAPNRTTNR